MGPSTVASASNVSRGACIECPRGRGLRRPLGQERGRISSLQLLLLIMAAFWFGEGCGWMPRYSIRSSRLDTIMTTPRTTLKKHTKVPLPTPGKDLMSLKVNEKLVGRVVGYKEVGLGRRVFVDVDVTRKGRGDHFYPVFGMIRLLGRYANMSVSLGQQFDCHVDSVNAAAGRLLCSLTPVFRRLDVNETTGAPLPTYELTDLKCGMPLTGMVVSRTDNVAYLDCGVVQSVGMSKPKRINGRLYRLDLQERFALAPKFKGPKTEALITPGMTMQAYVRNVFPDSNAYRLTVDPEITPEKAEAEQKERDELRLAVKERKDVGKLVIGTLRTGVITKVLPGNGGVKVGLGAKNTAFLPVSSLADAYGKEIRDLSKVVTVGGLLEVEIEEIDDDDRILLRCMRILKQPKPGAKKGAKKAATKTQKKQYADEEDDWSYDDVY